MSEIINAVRELLYTDLVRKGLKAALIMLGGFLLTSLLTRKIKERQLAPQQYLLVRQVLRYGILIACVVISLRELGIDLGVLLGAAGILTVALGFASQTSASNLISGVFLMGEQPFVVGDVIRVGDVTGEVLSIGSLSVNLRTFDNLSVRIPNETVLKSNVVNMTRFPIRRYDLSVNVAYDADLTKVRRILMEVADRIPICLVEPKPVVLIKSYGEWSIQLQLMLWSTKENYLELMNSAGEGVKLAFERAGIKIPFPQRTVRMLGSEHSEQSPRADAQKDAQEEQQQAR
jgi:small-conductance mechanosensitive channel